MVPGLVCFLLSVSYRDCLLAAPGFAGEDDRRAGRGDQERRRPQADHALVAGGDGFLRDLGAVGIHLIEGLFVLRSGDGGIDEGLARVALLRGVGELLRPALAGLQLAG